MIKVFILVFFIIFSWSAKSQIIDKTLSNIEQQNYGLAKRNIDLISKKKPIKYLASALYFQSLKKWDLSLPYFTKFIDSVDYNSKHVSKILERHSLDSVRIKFLRQEAQVRVYQSIAETPTLSNVNKFLELNTDFIFIEKAELLRDELALNNALENGTSSFLIEFMESYPNSSLFEKAQKIFCIKQFEENTPNKTDFELFNFSKNFPNNCLVDSSKNLFIEKCYETGNTSLLMEYIRQEKRDEFKLKAWATIYKLEVVAFEISELKSFFERYPQYPRKNQLLQDIELLESTLYPCFKGGKMGFMTKNGKVVIPHRFDEVYFFNNNLAVVGIGEKYGCIDKKGNVVIPLVYNVVYNFGEYNTIVEIDDLYGVVDRSNQMIIKPLYEEIIRINDNLFALFKDDSYSLCKVQESEILKGEYEEIIENKGEIEIVENGLKNIVVNRDTFLFDEWYDDIFQLNGDQFLLFKKDSLTIRNKLGVVSFQSKADALKLLDDKNKLFCFQIQDELYIRDISGKQLIKLKNREEEYTLEYLESKSGVISYKKKDKFGVINLNGELILKPIFNQIILCDSNILAFDDEGWMIYDLNGNPILDEGSRNINWLGKQLFSVERNNMVFVYNSGMKKIISEGYDNIKNTGDYLLMTEKNNKLGIINFNGELIQDCNYLKVVPAKNGIYALQDLTEIKYYDALNDNLITLNNE